MSPFLFRLLLSSTTWLFFLLGELLGHEHRLRESQELPDVSPRELRDPLYRDDSQVEGVSF